MPPHEPFATGRDELSVLCQQRAVRAEVQERVVDRAAGAFVDRYREKHAVFRRDRAERVTRRPGDIDGLIEPARVPLAVCPRRRPPDPVWIRRDEALRKRDERGIVRGRVLGQLADLLDRRISIEEHRRRLHGCDCGSLHAENDRTPRW